MANSQTNEEIRFGSALAGREVQGRANRVKERDKVRERGKIKGEGGKEMESTEERKPEMEMWKRGKV